MDNDAATVVGRVIVAAMADNRSMWPGASPPVGPPGADNRVGVGGEGGESSKSEDGDS